MKTNFHNNSQFVHKKNFLHFYCCNNDYFSPEFQDVLEHPDNYIRRHLLKEDQTFTTTVGLVSINNKEIVIKRYNIKNTTHQIKRAIQPSRAARCWYYAHLLQHYNINTPKPIAVIEKRLGLFRREAYFITEYIPGQDGFSVFINDPVAEANAIVYAKNTLALIKNMHAFNISHGDLKASNFIYNGETPYLIDLDAMKQHRSIAKAKARAVKDLNRFYLNWENLPAAKFFW